MENLNQREDKGPKKEKEREFLYWLCRVPGFGAVKIRKLYEYAGSFETVYNMKEHDLNQVPGLTKKDRLTFFEEKKTFSERAEEYHGLHSRGIQFITVMDDAYPKRLAVLTDPPIALFVKGKLPADSIPSAAIIGARSCSYYGREEAEYLGRELAGRGIQIVSGLAYGVDGAGQMGALNAGGAVYGVLGSGIDICYPEENRRLYTGIQKTGGVISEYGPGDAPLPSHFPVRNRIISALSDAVLVIEARKRSGSLITVELALEQGKDIFALPGRVTDPLSRGCNELIRAGAAPLLSPDDVLEYFGMERNGTAKVEKKFRNGLAKNEKMVYSCLDSQPKHIEQVVAESGLTPGVCIDALLKLELEGFVLQTTNQYYVRK